MDIASLLRPTAAIARLLALLLVALLAPACASGSHRPHAAPPDPSPAHDASARELRPDQRVGLHHPLLDDMLGEWVLRGTIGGDDVVHDVTVDRVLADGYVRIHELSRERDATGAPAYEAIVFIGWDTPNDRYTCLWLDTTSGEGLSEAYRDSVGHAVRDGDTLPFLFRFPNGSPWHTTFTYDRAADTWAWHMIGDDETAEPFAQVTLMRK